MRPDRATFQVALVWALSIPLLSDLQMKSKTTRSIGCHDSHRYIQLADQSAQKRYLVRKKKSASWGAWRAQASQTAIPSAIGGGGTATQTQTPPPPSGGLGGQAKDRRAEIFKRRARYHSEAQTTNSSSPDAARREKSWFTGRCCATHPHTSGRTLQQDSLRSGVSPPVSGEIFCPGLQDGPPKMGPQDRPSLALGLCNHISARSVWDQGKKKVLALWRQVTIQPAAQ